MATLLSKHTALFLALAALGITLINATNGDFSCPPGAALYGQRCYQTYRPGQKCGRDFNQTQAQQYCEANGGTLASVHSQEQNAWLAALIRKDQHAQNQRNKCSSCPSARRDYFYWIGLQLSHSANGSVNGASWEDNTPVDYGNPLSASFRPPFVSGQPEGTVGDGSVPGEVCPLGNEKECVAVYGYGKTVGRWTNKACNDSHSWPVSCSCPANDQSSNSTSNVPSHWHPKHVSSSSDEDEDHVDECRDEAALNGFVCEYCPTGWTQFQGHCYISLTGGGLPNVQRGKCLAFGTGVDVASIHSLAENIFVRDLASQSGITSSQLTGLRLTYTTNTFQAPPSAAGNWDGSPPNYGNPLIAPWNVDGTYPWAPAGPDPIIYPNQPDNRPPPADCVVMWLVGNPNPAGTWDDIECDNALAGTNGVTCKM